MGHKINPGSFRLPITKNWQSKWFGKKNFAESLCEDHQIRDTINKKFGKLAGIGRIEILRDQDSLTINIHTSKPGILIGRSGQGINDIKALIVKGVESFRIRNSNKLPKIKIEILEIKNPETQAQLVSDNIALQIEKRMPYKRAIKMSISKAMEGRVKGVKVQISGRLNGSEIARSEKYGESSVPLGRLRADIDYGYSVALTTYGTIGVKVWIYKGNRANIEE
ncbi:MAG: 30S ribosomal protein S3 [Candidatus Berkelbacteria bacterium]|nr:30S ribosomal protein S3 [Candidatus Berkelbacteria bacterium]